MHVIQMSLPSLLYLGARPVKYMTVVRRRREQSGCSYIISKLDIPLNIVAHSVWYCRSYKRQNDWEIREE